MSAGAASVTPAVTRTGFDSGVSLAASYREHHPCGLTCCDPRRCAHGTVRIDAAAGDGIAGLSGFRMLERAILRRADQLALAAADEYSGI